MSWKVECAVVGPIQCNCYILSDSASMQAYLIDPGAESKELMSFLEKKKLNLQAILITHAHIDHVGGIEFVHAKFPMPVFYHPDDQYLYENLAIQAQLFGVTPEQLQARQPNVGNASLRHGREIGKVRVIHTPGHTPGSVCFHATGDHPVLFSGDTLFAGSIGRTDLWGGDYDQIIESIRTRLLTLDDSLDVFPGHGEATTIGEERSTNPFLR
jgi:hydroxyacylglutathione hydrolase